MPPKTAAPKGAAAKVKAAAPKGAAAKAKARAAAPVPLPAPASGPALAQPDAMNQATRQANSAHFLKLQASLETLKQKLSNDFFEKAQDGPVMAKSLDFAITLWRNR